MTVAVANATRPTHVFVHAGNYNQGYRVTGHSMDTIKWTSLYQLLAANEVALL